MARSDPEFERVYVESGKTIWRAVYAYCGDPEIASDAVAEAFTQAMARGGTNIRSLEGWIWHASFRIANRYLMLRSDESGRMPERCTLEIPEPADHLVAALRQLSDNQRLAIVMHDYADRPVTEVGTAMGISTATVYVHLSRGRHRLRTLLEGHDA